MEIDSSIKIDVKEGVYNPAEDSYLLVKAIIAKAGEKTLDMGCGSGIVALHLAKNKCVVTACDINKKAVENTRINAEKNHLKIKVLESDLFSNIKEKFDVITFNPPYLPTRGEDYAWDGGDGGVETIERFLQDAVNHLHPNGRVYLVMSSLTDREKVVKNFSNVYDFKVKKVENLFFEKLFAYEITLRK